MSEVLGGEAETYYGVVDYLPNFNSVNEVVLSIMEDETLVEKHSSYKWKWFDFYHLIIKYK